MSSHMMSLQTNKVFIQRKYKTTTLVFLGLFVVVLDVTYFSKWVGSVVFCFKVWLFVTPCSWIRRKHGSFVTLNASLGSWREGKLHLRDAPLFQHNAAVQWFWDGQRKAARVGVRAKETKTCLTAQTRQEERHMQPRWNGLLKRRSTRN